MSAHPRVITFGLTLALFLIAGALWVAALAEEPTPDATPAPEATAVDEADDAPLTPTVESSPATGTPEEGDTTGQESPTPDSEGDNGDEPLDETATPEGTATPHPQSHLPVARNVAWIATATPTIVPGQVVTTVIGTSIEGRPIRAYRLGNGPKVLVLIGGIHTGPEIESVHIVEQLRDHFIANPQAIPSRVTLVFIPRVNPDGYVLDRRTNARRVDLNRNWPSANWRRLAFHGANPTDGGTHPLSEPETKALHDYLMDHRPTFSISYHGYASVIESNDVAPAYQLSAAYAVAANYQHITEWTAYPITGQFIDAMEERGLAAADVELQQNDASAFSRNRAGVVAVMSLMNSLP